MQPVLEHELVRIAATRLAASRGLHAVDTAGLARAEADPRLVEIRGIAEADRIGQHLVEQAQHVDADEVAVDRVQPLCEGRVIGDGRCGTIGRQLCAAVGAQVDGLGEIAQLRQRRQHDVARAGIHQRLSDRGADIGGLLRVIDIADIVSRNQRVVERVRSHGERPGGHARQETRLFDAKAPGGNHRVADDRGEDLLRAVTADREIEVVRGHRIGARTEHQQRRRGIHAPEAEVERQPFRHREAAQARCRVDIGEAQPRGATQLEVGKLPGIVVAGTEGDELAEWHPGRSGSAGQRRRGDRRPYESPHIELPVCVMHVPAARRRSRPRCARG